MKTLEPIVTAPLGSGPLLVIDDAVLELLPAAVYVCDAQGVIVRYNRKASELWGRSPRLGDTDERFCGSHRLFLPDGQPLPHDQTPMADALRTGQSHRDLEVQVEQPSGRRIWVLVNIDPIRNEAGEITGAINCFQDITARKLADDKVRDSERRSRSLLEALPAAVYTTDAAGRITFYNQAAVDLWGHSPELGKVEWCGSWRLYWPDGTPMPHDECPMAVALKEDRPIRGAEAVAERPDGTRVPFIPYPTPLHDASGALIGAVNMLVDITDRKRAEERQQLLINELNHRVKNTLATVQSIAAQSFNGQSHGDTHRWFEGRLMALSKAHDVLTRANWKDASLCEIVAQAVAPLTGRTDTRFDIHGPDLRLTPTMALSLAMALHELCTNAAKYGALSTETGRVHIAWEVGGTDAGRQLCLQWAETGGPPVEVPRRRGFGSRFIERGLAHELNAAVRLAYEPSGVICVIDAPLQQPG